MANEVMIILDPLGKTVYLPPHMCTDKNNEREDLEDAATVIRKPAVLIEAIENEQKKFYYFRSVGGNNTLLIRVHFSNDRWEAYSCVKNPSTRELSLLFRKGKQII